MELKLILTMIAFVLCIFLDFLRDAVSHYRQADTYKSENDRLTIFKGVFSDWKEKYVDRNPNLGYKKILGIPIPAFFSDGWHKVKAMHVWSYILVPSIAQPFMPEWQFAVILGVLWLMFWFVFERSFLNK